MLTLHSSSTRDCSGLTPPRFCPRRRAGLGGLSLAQSAGGKGSRACRRKTLRPRSLDRAAVPRRRREPHRDVQSEHGRPRAVCQRHGRSENHRFPASRSAAISRCSPSTPTSWPSSARSSHDNSNHPKAIIHVLTGGTDPDRRRQNRPEHGLGLCPHPRRQSRSQRPADLLPRLVRRSRWPVPHGARPHRRRLASRASSAWPTPRSIRPAAANS